MRIRRNQRSNRTMQIERYEHRQLMAADMISAADQLQLAETRQPSNDILFEIGAQISLNDGVLAANGTIASDSIQINEVGQLTAQLTTQASLGGQILSKSSRPQSLMVDTSLNSLWESRVRVTISDATGEILKEASFARSLVDSIVVSGFAGNDQVHNETGITSVIYGGPGNDVLRGGTGLDMIYGHAGDDRLYGEDGNDHLDGGSHHDRLFGQGGADVLVGNHGNDRLYGGEQNDRLYGTSGNDYLSGGSGDDGLYGGDGEDALYGFAGADFLSGGDHDDYLSGGSGADRIYGNGGKDNLLGGSGNDLLSGFSGDDTLRGGTGADTMYGGSGTDVMDGDSGSDTMRGGTGNDSMDGGSGNDRMYGEAGNDRLRGEAGDDDLYGGSGHDNLYGGSGNDYLSASSGDDGLYGGGGVDSLRGGSGDDRFLVLKDVPIEFFGFTVAHESADTILDRNSNDAKINFEHGEGKTFEFSGDRWATVADGEFTHAEIELVDQSLADLHHQVGNTTLLKKANGSEVTFKRLGEQTAGNFDLGGVNGGGTITLLDGSFDSGSDWLAQVVFHEIGHNWDNENTEWNAWKQISGWRNFFWPGQSTNGYSESGDGDWWYENDSTFARNYGKFNPKEDFATYFAKVMMNDNGLSFSDGGNGNTNTQKESFIDDFFASL